MGSKSRIANYIVPIIQEEINKNKIECYIEPFVGGSNVIDKIICKEKIGCDLDPYLIALLKRVQVGAPLYDNVDKKLWDEAKKECDTNYFYSEKFEPWQIGCIKYLASYNGRGSFEAGFAKDGIEHLKNGKKRERHYYQEAKANLLKQASKEQFQNIDFEFCDYRNISLGDRCLAYCDPPYLNTKQYENSKDFDHEEFWETMRWWSKDNIVLISELQAPDDFECIWKMDVSRSIKAQDKSRAIEKLFRYKG